MKKALKKETDLIMKALDKSFEEAGVSYSDIELICLTGGTAKMKQIKKKSSLVDLVNL